MLRDDIETYLTPGDMIYTLEQIVDYLTDSGELVFTYNDHDNTWDCPLCLETIRTVWDPPGHLQECDLKTFPHHMECPVAYAYWVLNTIEKRKKEKQKKYD